ncbi:MAG TPA: TonB-dependent receptor, partial [Vicinamibacterales bacterium]|nr:TonB-dependent receptor [Vicinamibacterales bacterium]
MGRTVVGMLVVLLSVIATNAAAQAGTATLSGTVQDDTGGSIPEVQIVVINGATGTERRATTGNAGAFTIALLPAGTYILTAERAGFAPAEIRNIVLNADDALALRVRLKVAGIGESLTVQSEPARITSSPAVATVIDRNFVANLPMNGRSFQTLVQLTPGVVQSANALERGQFSVNGQRAGSNSFTIDGVSGNVGVQTSGVPGQGGSGALPGSTVLGGGNSLVTLDALQEFSVQTSTYAPEYGRTPGAQVSIVTRGGSNELHGSLFEYFRDGTLDANDWFANRAAIAKPQSRQHLFGGSAGGPITRNRAFYFGTFEGLRLRQPRTAEMTVPSHSARTAAPTAIRPLFEAYPTPNGPELTGGVARSTASYTNPSRHNIGSVRVDLTGGGAYFVRHNASRSSAAQRSVAVASVVTDSYADLTSVTAGATHVLTPTVVNSLRYNVSRSVGGNTQFLDSFMGAVAPADSVLFPAGFANGFAIVNFAAGIGRLSSGVDIDHSLTQHTIVDTLSWTAGRHTVKAGVDFQHLGAGYGAEGQSQYRPTYNFASMAQASALTMASGIINVLEHVDLSFSHLSLFVQDQWTLSDRLSLTYGLRYERVPPPRGASADDQPSTVTSVDNLALVTPAPRGTPLYKTRNANFAPRIGAAWRLRDSPGRESVLRGGWGLFHDLGTGVIASAAGAFPFLRTKRLPANTTFPLSAAAAAPAGTDGPPYDLIRAFDPDIELPRVRQFNITLDQHLGNNQQISLGYVGARSSQLLRQENILNPNATIGQLQLTRNGDRSRYDSLQVQYQRRMSRGLQTLGSYVLSKSSDTSSLDGGLLPRSDLVAPDDDWGPSDFDVRHAFNAAVAWDLPAPSGNWLLDGWGLDATLYGRSALPVSVFVNRPFTTGFAALRPDV